MAASTSAIYYDDGHRIEFRRWREDDDQVSVYVDGRFFDRTTGAVEPSQRLAHRYVLRWRKRRSEQRAAMS